MHSAHSGLQLVALIEAYKPGNEASPSQSVVLQAFYSLALFLHHQSKARQVFL